MARLFDRFDPDRERWSSYLMRAEFYFDSNNITADQKKKAALCSTISPETFALLKNLLTREVRDVTYEDVKAALRQHYEEKRNCLAARLDFFRTVQQEGQSITDFLAELRSKAKESDFEEQCCVKCQDNTSTAIHAVRHSQPSRQKQRFRDKQCPEHAEMGQVTSQHNRKGQKVCYRCGSLTHHHRNCPFINAVCYGCDRKGHLHDVCRSSGKPVRKVKMAQHTVEQRTENIAVDDVFSTSTHVDKPQILLQISNVDLVFELDTGAAVSLVGPYIW